MRFVIAGAECALAPIERHGTGRLLIALPCVLVLPFPSYLRCPSVSRECARRYERTGQRPAFDADEERAFLNAGTPNAALKRDASEPQRRVRHVPGVSTKSASSDFHHGSSSSRCMIRTKTRHLARSKAARRRTRARCSDQLRAYSIVSTPLLVPSRHRSAPRAANRPTVTTPGHALMCASTVRGSLMRRPLTSMISLPLSVI